MAKKGKGGDHLGRGQGREQGPGGRVSQDRRGLRGLLFRVVRSPGTGVMGVGWGGVTPWAAEEEEEVQTNGQGEREDSG